MSGLFGGSPQQAQQAAQGQGNQINQQNLQQVLGFLRQYLGNNPNPMSQWGAIQGPNMGGQTGNIDQMVQQMLSRFLGPGLQGAGNPSRPPTLAGGSGNRPPGFQSPIMTGPLQPMPGQTVPPPSGPRQPGQ